MYLFSKRHENFPDVTQRRILFASSLMYMVWWKQSISARSQRKETLNYASKLSLKAHFLTQWEHKRCMLRIQRLRNNLMKRHCWEKSGDHKVIEIFSETRQVKRNIAVFCACRIVKSPKNITLRRTGQPEKTYFLENIMLATVP